MSHIYYERLPPDAITELWSSEDLIRHSIDEIHLFSQYYEANPTTLRDIDYYYYELHNLFAGPIAVLSKLSPFITVVLATRIAHYIIDLLLNLNFLKNIITFTFGCWQIHNYLNSLESGGSQSGRCLIFIATLFYMLISTNPSIKHPKIASSGKNPRPKFKTYLIVSLPFLINEYFIHVAQEQYHTHLRSILATLFMKVIHRLSQKNSSCSQLATFAYLLHPATCIFGPWHVEEASSTKVCATGPTSSFLELTRQSISALRVFTKTLVFLFISTTLSDLVRLHLIENFGSNLFTDVLSVYLVALEFRFSHYFMCHLLESLLTLWNSPGRLCVPSSVEWPRSLVEVVILWNKPMHKWLKDEIFLPIKASTSGSFTAVCSTYFVSSTLHGFKFNIWSVLLSLGLLTWIEHNLRRNLAYRFSACILARDCIYSEKNRCLKGHERTIYNSMFVTVTNALFRVLALLHLTYLGFIFKDNPDAANYKKDLHSWSGLYFYSPVLAIVTYGLNFITR